MTELVLFLCTYFLGEALCLVQPEDGVKQLISSVYLVFNTCCKWAQGLEFTMLPAAVWHKILPWEMQVHLRWPVPPVREHMLPLIYNG